MGAIFGGSALWFVPDQSIITWQSHVFALSVGAFFGLFIVILRNSD